MPPATQLRDAVADLSALAAADVRELFRLVTSPLEARDGLQELLPALIDTYGTAASSVAADWYEEAREEAEVAGRFRAIAVDVADSGAEELAGWGVTPLFADEPDWRRSLVLIEGGLERRIANASRDTIRTSSIEDPQADGWQRAGSGACAFCAMLIGRGAVYSERSVDFASHDACRCYAQPAFRGRPRPVRPYTPSERVASDADRARVREYLALHSAG